MDGLPFRPAATRVRLRMTPDARAARDRFPKGLAQPAGSFRFSADALLLASFAEPVCEQGGAAPLSGRLSEPLTAPPSGPLFASNAPDAILDLGTGCGVVALGLLLRFPHMRALGVDLHREPLEAACRNASALGLGGRFTPLCADVREGIPWKAAPLRAGSFTLATMNPPYRLLGAGRLPASPLRRDALFGCENTVPAFFVAAREALRPGGSVCAVFPLEREEALLAAARDAGLRPARMRRVYFREDAAPEKTPGGQGRGLVLMEALRAGNDGEPANGKELPAGQRLEDPLILHKGKGKDSRLTDEALAFCPWLGTR